MGNVSETTHDETDITRVDIDTAPTTTSATAAIIAAIVAAFTSAPFALIALPLGIGGIGMIAATLLRNGSRRLVSLGTASLFLSVVIAGGFGAPVEFLLLSTITTVLAWDFGQNAISLGEQMGRQTETQRNELIHASTSMIVGFVGGGLGYLIYLTSSGGHPVSALVLIVLGLVFLVWSIRT